MIWSIINIEPAKKYKLIKVRRIYQSLSGGYDNYECTKTEFMIAAQRISQLTPMEVDILFTMSDLYEANGRITMKDIERITPFEEGVLPYNIASQQSEQITAPGERNVANFVQKLFFHFSRNKKDNENIK